MDIRPKCICNGAPDLMFCCSGVADTAEIGDRAVRRLHKQGVARMYCLAGIPAKAEVIVRNAQAASRISRGGWLRHRLRSVDDGVRRGSQASCICASPISAWNKARPRSRTNASHKLPTACDNCSLKRNEESQPSMVDVAS